MIKEKILIVEDEKIIAIDLQRRLKRFGYQVLDIVSTGQEAINLAVEYLPDLVIMDIMLEKTDQSPIDGIDAALEIHSKHDIPVLFLTAYADEKTLERAKEAQPLAGRREGQSELGLESGGLRRGGVYPLLCGRG